MTSRFAIRRLLTIAALTLAWCGLWSAISVANLASGVALSVAVTAAGLGTSGQGGIRLIPLARFVRLVLVDLVVSTVSVMREVISRDTSTNDAIIAVDVGRQNRPHFLLLIIAITVTPGTAVVDADPDTGTLYLHLLDATRRDATVSHVRELADLGCAALPTTQTGVPA